MGPGPAPAPHLAEGNGRDDHHDDALGHADLDRRKADAGGVVHGLQHVIEQLAQTIVDGFDGLGLGFERRVRRDQDVQNCHGRDFLRRNKGSWPLGIPLTGC